MATPESTEPIVPAGPTRGWRPLVLSLILLMLLAVSGIVWYIGPERLGKGEFGTEAASVKFHIAYQLPRLMPGPPNPNAAAEFDMYRQSLAALVKSDFVITRALDPASKRKEKLPQVKDPAQVADRLKVEFTAPQVMRVSLRGYPQPQAIALLERITEEFLNEETYGSAMRDIARLNQLEVALKKTADEIRDLRSTLKSLLIRIAPQEATTVGEAQVRAYELATDELTRMQLELVKEEAELEVLTARAARKEGGSGAADETVDDREVLRTSIAIRKLAIERIGQEAEKIQRKIHDRGPGGGPLELESLREQIEDKVEVRQKISAELGLLKLEQRNDGEPRGRVRQFGPVH